MFVLGALLYPKKKKKKKTLSPMVFIKYGSASLVLQMI